MFHDQHVLRDSDATFDLVPIKPNCQDSNSKAMFGVGNVDV